jgi:hypothetical protein
MSSKILTGCSTIFNCFKAKGIFSCAVVYWGRVTSILFSFAAFTMVGRKTDIGRGCVILKLLLTGNENEKEAE